MLVEGLRPRWQATLERPWTSSFGSDVVHNLRAPLVEVDGHGEIAPRLAERLTSDPGGLGWTVVLREGVRFASGRPITADDVVASLRAQLAADDVTAAAVDARTVRLTLPAPRGDLPWILAQVGIARADQAEVYSGPPLPLTEIDASGKWMLASLQEPDAVLVPNPRALSRPWLARRILRGYGSQRSLVAAALAGEIDELGLSDDVRDQDLIRDFSPLRLVAGPLTKIGVLRFNCRSPRLADPRVRRALNLAIDRPAILARFVSADARAVGGFAGAPAVHDPAAAMALLAEAGWRPGAEGVRVGGGGERLSLTILMPPFFDQMVDVAQAVAGDLREIGVEAHIETGEAAAVQARRVAGDFDLTWTYYFDAPLGGGAQTFAPFRAGGPPSGANAGRRDFGRCGGPMQPWLRVFDQATSDAERAVAVAGVAGTAAVDPPAIFVYSMPNMVAVHERLLGRNLE